jgi:AcrR family transcriptional regulator
VTKVTQAHMDARRAAIRDAALRLFVQKGLEGARMEEIAAEAGLSAGAIYRYYPSKEQLLRAVLSYCVSQQRAMYELDLQSSESPLALLLAKGSMVWGHIGDEEWWQETILNLESALVAARSGGGVAEERRHMWTDTLVYVEELFRRAQAQGEIDPAIDARALTVTLLASCIGLDLLVLDRVPGVDPLASFAVIVEILRRFAPQPQEENT